MSNSVYILYSYIDAYINTGTVFVFSLLLLAQLLVALLLNTTTTIINEKKKKQMAIYLFFYIFTKKHSHEETCDIAFILNECEKMKFLSIIYIYILR